MQAPRVLHPQAQGTGAGWTPLWLAAYWVWGLLADLLPLPPHSVPRGSPWERARARRLPRDPLCSFETQSVILHMGNAVRRCPWHHRPPGVTCLLSTPSPGPHVHVLRGMGVGHRPHRTQLRPRDGISRAGTDLCRSRFPLLSFSQLLGLWIRYFQLKAGEGETELGVRL